jgi:hypothetical protein
MGEPILKPKQELHWMTALPGDALPAQTPWGTVRDPGARAQLQMDRLRYFRDLLVSGLRHALSPDPQSRTLRSERIALGIDLPELDTVPLWSARRDDGTVSIPFIEYLLSQICSTLEALGAEPRAIPPDAAEELRAARWALESILRQAGPDRGPAACLPRLSDVFISQTLLEQLCGREGLLDLTVRRCESIFGSAHALQA